MEDEEQEVSYLQEMLTHQYSLYGFLTSTALAGMMAIPYGWEAAAIPLVGFVAAEAIAGLFIPGSVTFKESVDKRVRGEAREATRERLIKELKGRDNAGQQGWEIYHRMWSRLAPLWRVAKNRRTGLSKRDVERLDDTTVDYLSLWLSRLLMDEREKTISETDLRRRLADIDKQLTTVSGTPERNRLGKARKDLAKILLSREGLQAKRASVEATMISMADSFEEIYHRVVANPRATDITEHLNMAVDRMRISEDLSHLDDDFEDVSKTLQRRVAQMEKA